MYLRVPAYLYACMWVTVFPWVFVCPFIDVKSVVARLMGCLRVFVPLGSVAAQPAPLEAG